MEAKALKLNDEDAREKWLDKRDKLHWSNESCLNYKPKDRMWVILTLTKNIAMLDPVLVEDQDGDLVSSAPVTCPFLIWNHFR